MVQDLVRGAADHVELRRRVEAKYRLSQPTLADQYRPQGALAALFTAEEPEVLLEGPAGTGKTRAALERWHGLATDYAGAKGLVLRKTLTSLTSSTLETYRRDVLPGSGVTFFGGSKDRPAHYVYPNGSTFYLGSLNTTDAIQKVLSTDYDWIYLAEGTEDVEADLEMLTTRLRTGVLDFQQILVDCNPDRPTHWLNLRGERSMRRIRTRHHDNPRYWDEAAGKWTPEGERYVQGTLARLTGVRRDRLYLGLWRAAEGAVYEEWDPQVHVLPNVEIPTSWPRYWAIDFGYTNPFVWLDAAEDPDGRLWITQELYQTGLLVSDAAHAIRSRTASEPRPRAIICDHDAEGRATLERELGLRTTAAHKAVTEGLQIVQRRLRVADDGRPRLLFLADRALEPDSTLVQAGKPTTTVAEFDGYVWDTRHGQRRGEEPVKEDDHGMDAVRYLCSERENRRGGERPTTLREYPRLAGVGRREVRW